MAGTVEKMVGVFDLLMHGLMSTGPDDLKGAGEILSLQELRIIYFIGQSNPRNMRAISSALRLKISNTSVLMRKLEVGEFVALKRQDKDRRIVQPVLTVKGSEVHKAMYNRHVDFFRHILSVFNKKEQSDLAGMLDKLLSLKELYHENHKGINQ